MLKLALSTLMLAIASLAYHLFSPQHIYSLEPYELPVTIALFCLCCVLVIVRWIIRLATVPRTIKLEDRPLTVSDVHNDIIEAVRKAPTVRQAVDMVFEKHRIPKKEIYEQVMKLLASPQEHEEVKMSKDTWDLSPGEIVQEDDMWSVVDEESQDSGEDKD
ncbi:MAG: hypothetical protein P9M14_05320 [Candidatus Alcyoniella australis]|nr:hypothetical protein [Candidatus Alcyoniella australis]